MKPTRSILPCLATFALAAGLQASVQSDIGFPELQKEFGAALPTGSNLSVLVVEAPDSSGNWAVAKSGELAGRTITFPLSTTTPTTYSAHANTVAKNLTGVTTSILPALAELKVAPVSTYRNTSLKLGAQCSPIAVAWDLENHSLISNVTTYNLNALQLLDYRIVRDGVTVVVALENGTGAMQPLWGNNYNTIAVGSATGTHTRGGTNFEGSGRLKPDLVGTATYTSYATPVVTSAAGLLIAEAKRTPALATAKDPRTIKALLMAGATKEEFSAWAQTPAQPLDPVYGTGQVNIYNSYKALVAGRQSAAAVWSAARGWDLGKSSTTSVYYFEVPTGQTVKFSTVLTWYREQTTSNFWTFTGTLADLNLRLRNSNASFALGTVVAESSSALDNVEHIYRAALPAGQYALEVSGPAGVNYGIAWHSTTTSSSTGSTGSTGSTTGTTTTTTGSGNELVPVNYTARGQNGTKEGVANLFDRNTATKWLDFAGTTWVQATLAAPSALASYSLTSANDFDARDPYTWTVSGSNDGVSWTVIDTRTAQTFATRKLQRDFPLSQASAPYRYFRLAMTCKSGSITQLADLAFVGAGSSTTGTTTTTTIAAPAISAQPAPVRINEGEAANFCVTATGDSLTYQWARNGVAIAGATTGTYSIGTALVTDAGNYTVTVSNTAGSVTSAAANLTVQAVLPPPPTSTGALVELIPAAITARGQNGTKEGTAKLLDHTPTTKWLDFAGKTWVQISLSAPRSLESYSFTSANDFPVRDPYNWTVSGSNDGVTWTVIETRTAQTFASRFLQRDFVLAQPSAAFLYFRFDIACKSGSITQLADLELWGN